MFRRSQLPADLIERIQTAFIIFVILLICGLIALIKATYWALVLWSAHWMIGD